MATHSGILAWKFHGQRSLVVYSPWGCKESDTTEHGTVTVYTYETVSPVALKIETCFLKLLLNSLTIKVKNVMFDFHFSTT